MTRTVEVRYHMKGTKLETIIECKRVLFIRRNIISILLGTNSRVESNN